MNRAFKIEFHNGAADQKTIVSMSVSVRNGKRFNELDKEGLAHLITNIQRFQESVQGFKEEMIERKDGNKIKTNHADPI